MPRDSLKPTRTEAAPPAARHRLDRSVIETLPLFQGLDAAALAAIVAAARPRRIPKGETLFAQGEAAHGLFVILDGRLKAMQVTPDGQQVVMRYAGTGDLVGHVAVFGSPPYPASAIAVVDSLVLAWDIETMNRLLQQHPALALNALAAMGGRLQEAHTRIREGATERIERRIAHALLRLVRQSGRQVESGVEIDFPITRQDLAEMTGTTLFTVSRVLSAWEQEGLVDGGRQRIVIRNPHALVRIADDIPPHTAK
jgi:CRP-like cAMP-binding protein